MCDICQKEVIDHGILESDLPMLPFTQKKWTCLVPGCRRGAIVRDYGNDPFYFDPRKIWRGKASNEGRWRGGWFDATNHFLMCNHHGKSWQRVIQMLEHRFSAEYFLSKIREKTSGIKNASKKAKESSQQWH